MKFLTIVFIFVGLVFLFNAGGIETPSGGLVKGLLDDGIGSFDTGQLWTNLKRILTGTIIVGAVASLFGRTPDVSWVLAGLASLFGGLLLSDMFSIWNKLSASTDGWILWAVTLIMGLMLYGFFISLIGWWRGADG